MLLRAFNTDDLTTAIGPVTGTPLFNSGSIFATNLGNFILTSVGTPTFTATLGRQVGGQAAPTLSGWSMISLGLLLAAVGVSQLGRRARNFPIAVTR